MEAKTKLIFDAVKLLEYLVSAVIVVSSNPCVGPSPITKIFFSLSVCGYEL